MAKVLYPARRVKGRIAVHGPHPGSETAVEATLVHARCCRSLVPPCIVPAGHPALGLPERHVNLTMFVLWTLLTIGIFASDAPSPLVMVDPVRDRGRAPRSLPSPSSCPPPGTEVADRTASFCSARRRRFGDLLSQTCSVHLSQIHLRRYSPFHGSCVALQREKCRLTLLLAINYV